MNILYQILSKVENNLNYLFNAFINYSVEIESVKKDFINDLMSLNFNEDEANLLLNGLEEMLHRITVRRNFNSLLKPSSLPSVFDDRG